MKWIEAYDGDNFIYINSDLFETLSIAPNLNNKAHHCVLENSATQIRIHEPIEKVIRKIEGEGCREKR